MISEEMILHESKHLSIKVGVTDERMSLFLIPCAIGFLSVVNIKTCYSERDDVCCYES